MKNKKKELQAELQYWKSTADKYLDEKIELEEKRRDLEVKVSELEARLAETEVFDNTIKEVALPKCESRLCQSCAHCLTQWVGGQTVIIGCRKDLECGDYKSKSEIITIPRYEPIITDYYNHMQMIQNRWRP